MESLNKTKAAATNIGTEQQGELMIILGENAMKNYLFTKSIKAELENEITVESFENLDYLIDFLKKNKPLRASFLVVYNDSFKLKIKSLLCQLDMAKMESNVVLYSEEETTVEEGIVNHDLVLGQTFGEFRPKRVVELMYCS